MFLSLDEFVICAFATYAPFIVSEGEMKGTGQMGRLGQLRPTRIAKTRGAGAGEVILHPSRARGRRGKLCWSATSAKVVKVYLRANNADERIWEFAKVRTGEWPSVIMVKSYLSHAPGNRFGEVPIMSRG